MDAKGGEGRTPLHCAAEEGRAAVVGQLLAAGAAMDAKDDDRRTPLYRAARGGRAAMEEQLLAAVVEQLRAAGADGAAAADDGSTPRSIAQDDEVLAMLVAAEDEVKRLRIIAFAMGLKERLGAASVVRGLEPELMRMVVELVYPPVDNVR